MLIPGLGSYTHFDKKIDGTVGNAFNGNASY